MDQSDFDKLLLISNSTEEYIKAVLVKLKDAETDNGHEMSDFYCKNGVYMYDGTKTYTLQTSHCKKCIFEIDIDFINTSSGININVDFAKVSKKCPCV